jgi:hypothetical protein
MRGSIQNSQSLILKPRVARTVYGERPRVKRKENLELAGPAPSRRDVVKIAQYEVLGDASLWKIVPSTEALGYFHLLPPG